MSRKPFSFSFDESLKDRAINYGNRKMPKESLSSLLHRGLFNLLAEENNQLEEVEK